tara:strand:+ start:518 stop:1909 length:1392 start_codon:yes stop_codon:yes gene_type:complete
VHLFTNYLLTQIINLNYLGKFYSLDLRDSYEVGKLLFYIGLFLIPSVLSLGILSLFISSTVSFKSDKESFFKEKYSFIFFISSIFLTLSSLVNFFDNNSINNISDAKYLTLLGLLNWLPLIFCFRSFQKFLKYPSDRKRCCLILISGTVPVLFSCISQIFFKWYGPFETLFGLITWFQRPIDGITGVTGLFSNPNYLSAWLIIIWPFCLAIFAFERKEFKSFFLKFLLITLTSSLIVLTASRAAWICLIISIPLFYGIKKINKFFFYLLGILSFIVINISVPILGKNFQELLKSIIPEGLWINLTSAGFDNLDISRIGIWIKAIDFIKEKPLLGHGARSFPQLLSNDIDIWKGHAHNLPLELMVNYGIPAALLTLIPIFFLVVISYRKIFIFEKKINKISIFDRAWISSSILLIIIHMIDIQYFDARISIVGWILISGLKNIASSEKYGNNLNENNPILTNQL